MEIPDGKGRLGWFDAMRGLAIVLVVLGHVLQRSFNMNGDYGSTHYSILYSTICTFHVPLFFLISGFFGYKACESWTLRRLGDFVKRKFQALIICTLVFLSLYLYCHENTIAWLYNGFLVGYWFTFVLFQMFMVFLVLSLLSKLFKSECLLDVGLILISIIGIGILAIKVIEEDSILCSVLCTENLCRFFQFFTLGIFCRKYQALFESLLSKNWFKVGITICAVACLVLRFNNVLNNHESLYRFVRFIPTSYAMLLVVVAFFFTKREFFEKQNATSSVLRYVGRRTLDIYMIHYFFLPDLGVLTEWIAPNSMFIFQLTIGLVVSAMIIAPCLLLSEILRSSDFLSAWLFGVKIKRRE